MKKMHLLDLNQNIYESWEKENNQNKTKIKIKIKTNTNKQKKSPKGN